MTAIIKNGRPYLIIAFATLSLSVLASPEEMEIIEVKGQHTIPYLKKQIDNTRIVFYELFNKHNDNNKFDVLCRVQKRVGSNIADKVCEPRYIKETRARLIMERATSGMSIDLRRLPTERDVQMAAKQDKEDSLLHMQELIISTPELREKYLELQSLVANFENRKDSKD